MRAVATETFEKKRTGFPWMDLRDLGRVKRDGMKVRARARRVYGARFVAVGSGEELRVGAP